VGYGGGCGSHRAVRRWNPRLWGALAGMALWLAGGSPGPGRAAAAPEPEVDPIGHWYVLIHYQDSASDDPGAERWDDRVWSFEMKGSRLQWTVYPIVIFKDESGRFESLGSTGSRRILGYWEPSAAQLARIRRGLEVNPRGSRSKGLRGSAEQGYASAGGLRAQGASVIGYSESWEIDGLPGAPVFTRAVVMGSARTENMQGLTRFTTLEVSEGGGRLEGRYQRDGTCRGTFAMLRVGELKLIGAKGSREKAEPRRTFLDDFDGEFFGDPREREVLEARIQEQGDSAVSRRELRQRIVEVLKQAMRERDPGSAALRDSELEALAARLEALIFDEGKSLSQIEQMWRQGELRP